jgi:hypothetical protein
MTQGANGVWEATVGPLPPGGLPFSGEFEPELVADIMPQMEKRYRV